ncbi:hypothetical protein [Falsiroseomonas sp.]|uniref:hypothetical protein n=1 Tax=Falsiroseomonas sp. TaxID=2870721 RepID=UPI003561B263
MQVALRTQTFAMVAAELGPAEAHSRLLRQVAETAPRHQDAWDRNLAAAHLEHLQPEQLASIAELGPRSPHFQTLLTSQDAIGRSMQARSGQLLQDIVAEIIGALFRQIVPR